MSIRIATPFLLVCLGFSSIGFAQSKADKKIMKQLQTDISYLASDELEGRRTGTEGERKAAMYIEKTYRTAGIPPYNHDYRHTFNFTYGKEITQATHVSINGVALEMNEDCFPMPFSACKKIAGDVLPELQEQGNIWLMPLYASADEAKSPHFDMEKVVLQKGKEAEKQGASGVVFYDNFGSDRDPVFNRHSEYDAAGIPLVYLSYKGYVKAIGNIAAKKEGIAIDMDVAVCKAERTGTNIAAYIDNGANYTVVLGAHYDHLGYGEDGNSLHANAKKDHQIHHGADDNASGTAALLELAKWVKKKKPQHYNYLFVNFSGEELGLYGSKAFVKKDGIDSTHIAYMLNMDMVGRLNDSTHALTLGGVGTSPAWADVVTMGGDDFKIVIDSSGTGPSDHTSFYNAGIPVLFFFTGTHRDYHKPSDRAETINYAGEASVIKYVSKVVGMLDKEETKPAFTPTRQVSVSTARFKVTLGIMPDYTYESGGVRVDGVSDNRPAMKAGIKTGDIITALGDNKITGMQSYMEALGKFAPGDVTSVTIQRDGKALMMKIELSK